MKRMRLALLTAAACVYLTSCSIVLPLTATSNPVGSKVGESTATIFLGVLAFDQDASIQKAAKDAGITKISTVDVKRFDILGIYSTYTTIVTGE